MIKGLMRDAALALQAKSGLTTSLFVWLAVAALAALTAFAFLCVAGYDWLATLFGPVFAGLIAAGFFILCAALAAMLGALARRRARQRAILERAARGHGTSWLLDPKVVATAVQFGRSLGWQRLVPIALLGFIAAQWARESRQSSRERDE
ncbi:MAG: hypothetical protein WBF58_05995 [Xanthobacteraceae bacterium]